VRFNVALFYSTITDVQVPTLVLPQAITVTKNAGKMESKGFDAELNATLIKGLEASWNVGYTDAVYKSLKVAQNGEEVNLDGNHQVYTPDFTSMAALQYTLPISKTHAINLIARGEWMYLGRQYFDLANSIRQSPYHLLNTQFGILQSIFNLSSGVRILTDQKHIAYAYDFACGSFRKS
jgi:iron complex outermembrane receptor protein